jgi:hypothetical protein
MEEPSMVLNEARPHLKILAELAPQINEASDRYTEELKAIEAELSQLNIGIEVESGQSFHRSETMESTPLDQNLEPIGRNEPYFLSSRLGYEKLSSGRWGFTVREYRYDPDKNNNYADGWKPTFVGATPLLSASRELRIESAEHIHALLAKLTETVKQKIAALKAATNR